MAVYKVRTRPCTWAVKSAMLWAENVNTTVYRLHGQYTVVYPVRSRPYTCTQAVKTTVCMVHGPCTAVYTERSRGRVQALKTTVCTVHGRVHGRVRIMHGPVPSPYTPSTAVYTGRKHARVQGTRPCLGHKWTMYTARERPCTRSVHGRSDGQRPSTRAVNTAVYMTTVYRP